MIAAAERFCTEIRSVWHGPISGCTNGPLNWANNHDDGKWTAIAGFGTTDRGSETLMLSVPQRVRIHVFNLFGGTITPKTRDMNEEVKRPDRDRDRCFRSWWGIIGVTWVQSLHRTHLDYAFRALSPQSDKNSHWSDHVRTNDMCWLLPLIWLADLFLARSKFPSAASSPLWDWEIGCSLCRDWHERSSSNYAWHEKIYSTLSKLLDIRSLSRFSPTLRTSSEVILRPRTKRGPLFPFTLAGKKNHERVGFPFLRAVIAQSRLNCVMRII